MKYLSGTVILTLLQQRYGPRIWQPHHDPLAELVLTILSQNTSDKNSRPAFLALKTTFPDWARLLEADIADIAGPIKSGGLAVIKAGRIQSALRIIKQRHGSLNLDFLVDLPFEEAREWLLELPGVGLKTAACVLLFALGRPAMPVDTHVYRVATRLGLIPLKTSLENAHRQLEKAVPAEDIYEFHMLMIEHGRRNCSARRPDCQSCICKTLCKGYDKYKSLTKGG
jgi:endonuclease-3